MARDFIKMYGEISSELWENGRKEISFRDLRLVFLRYGITTEKVALRHIKNMVDLGLLEETKHVRVWKVV